MRMGFYLNVEVLVTCLLLSQAAQGVDLLHDGAESPARNGGRSNSEKRRVNPCDGFPPEFLTEISNQETPRYEPMGAFLFSPECSRDKKETIIKQAIKEGIQFKEFPNLNLVALTNQKNLLTQKDLEELDVFLKGRIPDYLRDQDLQKKDLTPLTGQLAVLSPDSARYAFIYLMQKEIVGFEQKYESSADEKDKNQIAEQLASKLSQMDIQEEGLKDLFSKVVEEKAMLAQADSLAKMFKMMGISAIRTNNADIAELFDRAAFGFSKIIQNGKKVYSVDQKSKLLLASLEGLKVSSQSDLLEQGMLELHQSLMTFSEAFKNSSQKKGLWNLVTKTLGQSGGLPILAFLYSKSLTTDIFQLSKEDKTLLLETTRNYPEISKKIQTLWVVAYDERQRVLKTEEQPPSFYVKDLDKNLIPMVPEIFERDPDVYTADWLERLYEADLVADEIIEKKYPRIALGLIGSIEKESLQSNEEFVQALWGNIIALQTLSASVVPTLDRWVKKMEKK